MRDAARTAALAVVNPELKMLIEEQAVDSRKWGIAPQTPWGVPTVSLSEIARNTDGRLYEEVICYEGNLPWDDPTCDSVLLVLAREQEEAQREVHEWNLDHREMHRRPLDVTNYGQAPAFQAGVTGRMATRHRGKAASSMQAGGRPARQSKAKV